MIDLPLVWSLVIEYVPEVDIRKLKCLSKTFRNICYSKLYKSPLFGTSVRNPLSPIDAFKLFLTHLERSSKSFTEEPIGYFIKELNLSQVQESLYDSLSRNWLDTLARYCPKLEVLDLRHVEYLNDSCIQCLKEPIPSLKVLKLESQRNLTTRSLLRLASLCPQLRVLEARDCETVLNDAFIGSLPIYTPFLEKLAITRSSITAKGLSQAFSKNSFKLLRDIDFSETIGLTDEGLLCIATSLSPIENVTLKLCPNITTQGLTRLAQNKLKIRHLDLSLNTKLDFAPSLLVDLFSALGPSLTSLALSYTPIDRSRTEKPLLLNAFEQLSQLESLTLGNIYETTPHNIIKTIASTSLPKLRKVVLWREQYTSDDMLGYYAPVEERHLVVNQAFVDDFNNLYGKRVKMELNFIEARSL